MLLWPRFKSVFDANFKSIATAHSQTRRLGTVDLTPHYVTRRYAEFTASLLALHSG
jgi:vacuolar protein sorting-associated protein 52